MLAMFFVGCTPPGDTLGTPEYFAKITGISLELDDPIGSCRHYTGIASEGSSVFVWQVSSSQASQLKTSLPNHHPQASSHDAEIAGWQPAAGMENRFHGAAQYAEKGQCTMDAGISKLTRLLTSMFDASDTVSAQVAEGEDVGDLYIFSPELNLFAKVGFVN